VTRPAGESGALVAPRLGMTPLPPLFFAILLLMIAMYLTLVEIMKHWFYRVTGL
jgi:hypothetical protein